MASKRTRSVRRGRSTGTVPLADVQAWVKATPLSTIDALLPARTPMVDREALLEKVAYARSHRVVMTVAELRTLNRARLNEMVGMSRGQKSVSEILDERRAKAEQGTWIPASGGTEKPFRTRSGKRLQYLYQPSTGRHAYYDVDSDLILSDEEAMAYLPGGKLGGMAGGQAMAWSDAIRCAARDTLRRHHGDVRSALDDAKRSAVRGPREFETDFWWDVYKHIQARKA